MQYLVGSSPRLHPRICISSRSAGNSPAPWCIRRKPIRVTYQLPVERRSSRLHENRFTANWKCISLLNTAIDVLQTKEVIYWQFRAMHYYFSCGVPAWRSGVRQLWQRNEHTRPVHICRSSKHICAFKCHWFRCHWFRLKTTGSIVSVIVKVNTLVCIKG